MAHVIGSPRPDVAFSRDVAGGPAMLIDFRAREWIDLSLDTSAVLEVDASLCETTVERARSAGVNAAGDEVELFVRLELGSSSTERSEAERAVLETLADVAVRQWLDAEKGRR